MIRLQEVTPKGFLRACIHNTTPEGFPNKAKGYAYRATLVASTTKPSTPEGLPIY